MNGNLFEPEGTGPVGRDNETAWGGGPLPRKLRLQQILVPVDFSPHSLKALRYASAFAQQFGARLILLHVNEPVVFPSELGYAPLATEALDQSLREDAQTRLKALAHGCGAEGLSVETAVVAGRPFNEIVAVAAEREVDLIIIATHGFTGFTHVLMGSTAERVIRHAKCPVLVVRENEREFLADEDEQKSSGTAPS